MGETAATKSRVTYEDFLDAPTGPAWRRLGARRRAGVCVPLFSVWSKNSVGVGEYLDLPLLADWCRNTGQSILQLLPLNDAGFDFAPYSSQSSFALDPLHLSLDRLVGVQVGRFAADIAAIRKRFPIAGHVDYRVKLAKLELLGRIFAASGVANPDFITFQHDNEPWLKDYALYKTLKEKFGQKPWEMWDAPFRDRAPGALEAFRRENAIAVLFHKWLQWQCAEQMAAAHRACNGKGVFLMGDMPFLVARDSADVWTFRDSFKLELESGAPPDVFSDKGQRWGMPPYDWGRAAAEGWRYPTLKLRTAERYYDLFRVDHVIGVFRLFVIPVDEPAGNGAKNGRFDPENRLTWEEQGRRILGMMVERTGMLPCGEDLGDVPTCSDRVLKDFAVPGLNVQRWRRDWEGTKDFTPAGEYRRNACAVISTHDTSLFTEWWSREADAEEKRRFAFFLQAPRPDLSPIEALGLALGKAAESPSIFSVQLIQDLWALGDALPGDPAEWRVNTPGTVGAHNWSVVLPRPLEEWGSLPMNEALRELHRRTGRE
jgi:4-alpha-glucanotransferase